mmetsp:Transcript_1356/g.1426  ORF Transcript_1356/g.1426 Transcript_1356/m.1426 type:complete len:109 (-) Transcript_1356:91-417(-)
MLRTEIDRLTKRIRDFEKLETSGGESGDIIYLKRKIYFLEKTLEQVEKERSELSMKCTMSEEQLKRLQEQMNVSVQTSQRKIIELKKMVQHLKIKAGITDERKESVAN